VKASKARQQEPEITNSEVLPYFYNWYFGIASVIWNQTDVLGSESVGIFVTALPI